MAAQEPDSPRVRVAALIVYEDQVVLVRHRKGDCVYHLLPGGGVEWGEPLADALGREVAEETGLLCSQGNPILINDTIAPDGSRHLVNITFACEASGDITDTPLDDRIEGVELVEPSRLLTMDLRPPIAAHLINYLDDPNAWDTRYIGSVFTAETGCPE